ncbi:MAG: hypothetical protein A2087_12645 [Spirochaetes bacterium GWD1_61_31]|nr:MAG: hypothetical protein A2Y37_11365 [Spirochaetes bacterium GWB1_60_80]OHD32987.1 MAG: hypothetical protein A2004_07255 [Spirochaetes bacterium GWC1_61_12]OHD38365.1 MAG: hypothetical protein A2087_12645 [Spirochaetes bacterium GWD1_61_31]OHD43368.1 MAG: hypothetical protein A2Y35_02135 [Spirochaetes bacterium GWE1_60_18]OHD58899.1 MAG: hypothetical protein A2Y32_10575 [Spirochaetes bacterium GWF1_60_12]
MAGSLTGRFYMTELFANLIGAPLATIYGGSLIDFGTVPLGLFLSRLAIVIVVNQIFLALPLNGLIGYRLAGHIRRWQDKPGDEGLAGALYRAITGLPLLQAGLVFVRMLLCAGAGILLVSTYFDSGIHLLAVWIYAMYASFLTGLVIYYYLHAATTGLARQLVADGHLKAATEDTGRTSSRQLRWLVSIIPLALPSLLTSGGIMLLTLVIRQGHADLRFFTARILLALAFNLVTIPAILIYTRYFSKQRLQVIRQALRDMVERGDTAKHIPTDLRDDNSLTAAQINQAFDLFRLVLDQLGATAEGLAGAVMGFSSQNRQTVAATTQQASAVKEIVSTMQDSSQISRQIQEQSHALASHAAESQNSVDEGFGKVQDTIQKMSEIRAANQQTLSEINDLTEEIASIGEIIEIINSIANQTRIIAFNAELEASSAGAAGASFRIVAEEIRRLAKGTVESLAGIKGRVSQIQQSSERLQATSEEGTAKIDEGMNLSRDLNQIFMQVRSSAESTAGSARDISGILIEQTQAFDQIFATLKQISEGAEQIMASTRDSGNETGKLQRLVEELQGVLGRFANDKAGATRKELA